MVNVATSFGRTALQDWILQRISALYLGLYSIFLFIYFNCTENISFDIWQNLFSNLWFQIASFFAIIFLSIHAWIGIWTVMTDYVKPFWLRLTLQVVINLLLVSYVIWGACILWG